MVGINGKRTGSAALTTRALGYVTATVDLAEPQQQAVFAKPLRLYLILGRDR